MKSIQEATTTDSGVASTVLSPYSRFKLPLKSKEVQRQYPNLLGKFLDFCKFEGLDIEQKALIFSRLAKSKSQEEAEDLVIRFVLFQKERVDKKEITAGTLRNYVKAIKLFCRMNRINLFWDIISRSLPKVKQYSNDRIPTVEEIKKLIEYPDRRIKPIVFLSLSTGIRVGAWDYMKWKHFTPIKNENGVNVAAKLVVYPNEPEEYFTFMTPEAYNTVKEWMDFRASFGEDVTGESWILRNRWQKVKPRYSHRIGLAKYPRQFKSTGIKTLVGRARPYNTVKEWMDFRASFGEDVTGESWILRNRWQKVKPRYSHRIGLAKYPRQFKSTGIKTLVGRALQIQGIRTKLDLANGEKNHDWKTLHGFRKFFKTQTERVMKSLNVEILMGHDIGLADSYYRPSEQELLEDYLKAVDLLSIHRDKSKLEKQVRDLKEKSNDNDFIIKGKLDEKDKQIAELTRKQERFENLQQNALIDSSKYF